MWFLLAFWACGKLAAIPASPAPDSGPVADPEGSGVPEGSNPCVDPPDPNRSTAWADILLRLEAQRCLHPDDIDLVRIHVEGGAFGGRAREGSGCHDVWRVSSPDGWTFTGPAEHVWDFMSVPDVAIDANGTHWIVGNDRTPNRLVELLEADPARLFRQGLLGYGGVGMLRDDRDGSGVMEVDDLSIAMDRLQLMVDPDLAATPDGFRLLWFGITPETLNPEDDRPASAAKPHLFLRATGATATRLDPSAVAIASSEAETGGSDPTMLDREDGGEGLFLGPMNGEIQGWWSADGEVWPADTTLVSTGLRGVVPDAYDAPGDHRLYYIASEDGPGAFSVATSPDQIAWTPRSGHVYAAESATNLSIARAPDGTFWLYFNLLDPNCAFGE